MFIQSIAILIKRCVESVIMSYEGCYAKDAPKNSFIITLIQSTFEMTKLLGGSSPPLDSNVIA